MRDQPGIYWIQGLDDSGWRTLRRCADHDDATARMGPLLTDRRFRETRLVLAQSQDGRIEYTTLVKTRNGVVVPDNSSDTSPVVLPAALARATTASRKRRAAVFAGILVAAIGGGLAIAKYNQNFAVALYEGAATLVRPDEPDRSKPLIPAPAPPPPKIEPSYTGRLFAAVDANDAAATRRLMVARPSDLRLDELRDFVDDGWGTGPRAIVDYALLGGHIAAAEALLSAGATPSDWLRGVITRNVGLAALQPAIALLMEFGALPEISIETAVEETNRELGGIR